MLKNSNSETEYRFLRLLNKKLTGTSISARYALIIPKCLALPPTPSTIFTRNTVSVLLDAETREMPITRNTKLLYEIEYILGGQYSDKENLEYVVNRLVLLRFALNSAYAFGNEELRAQALSMAAMLTGITGTPEFIEAVRYIILAAVNHSLL